MRTLQRERMTVTGDYARVNIFPVRRTATGKRGKKNKPTSETMRKLNQKNRENRLADLLHLNFGREDYFIRLSYRDEGMPANVKDAEAGLYNFLRRLRTLRKKEGLEPLKYIYVTEVGTKTGRIHHHIFLNGGIDRDTIEKMWKYGYANSRRLQFDTGGLVGLSKYCAKGKKAKESREKTEEATVRTWKASKGLRRPRERKEIFQNDSRISSKTAAYIDAHPDDRGYIEKLYPDYRVSAVETTPLCENGETQIPQAHFLTIYLYRRDADFAKNGKGNRQCD